LRKYGVRFGAYHIYVAALLKPAARALASLLWAQKQESVDLSALSSAQHLAASGRTSFPADKLLDHDAYRALGYRQCGERAVRVDILERLADLIRPALAWREGAPGQKPPGAFDGRGFVVTQAMTSLVGTAGEEFASILRALGYRMDRRPAPPPVAPADPATDAAGETVSADAPENARLESATADAAPPDHGAAPDIAVASDAGLADSESAATADGHSSEDAAAPALADSTNESSSDASKDEFITVEAASAPEGSASAASATPAAQATDATPATIEVWRPGGRFDARHARHDRNRHRRPQPRQDGAPAVDGEGAEAIQNRERHGRRRRARQKDVRQPAVDAPAEAVSADGNRPDRERRDDKGRPPRERFQGKGKTRDRERDQDKGRFQGSRKGGGRDGRPDGPALRPYASSAPRERDRPIDPNSPFAKLAALKEQLAGRKD
jgi:ATP-dependent RNA helicase SUPV3L1/SUV3